MGSDEGMRVVGTIRSIELQTTGAKFQHVTPRQVAPYETFDTQVSYVGFKALKLTLGVKNLLDQNPPYTNYGAGFVGSYDLSYTDVRGRFVYTTATYSFK